MSKQSVVLNRVVVLVCKMVLEERSVRANARAVTCLPASLEPDGVDCVV